MSNKPNKGFIKEIAKDPRPENKKDGFKWGKAIVKPSADGQATPYRIREYKAVKPSKTNLALEVKNKKVGK